MSNGNASVPVALVGDECEVPCVDGTNRRYLSLDAAASTSALPSVAARIHEFLPWYSSVHRGAGFKSRQATNAYEHARAAMLRFAGRSPDSDDVAIICRNTTEAINHLAYRLRLERNDVVVSTVIEHHANLLPWTRLCHPRFVECGIDGTFGPDDVIAALEFAPRPKLLAITGASNVTGWAPALDDIIAAAHTRGIRVFVDAAQLAPHRPLPEADFVAWSGHKMYAPFGAVALHAAIDEFERIGLDAIEHHDHDNAQQLRGGLATIDKDRLLRPPLETPTLPVATFVVDGVPHALVAARLSAEHGIGVRHGCFCAHPYLLRLLGLPEHEVHAYRDAVRRGDRRTMPGAVRASGSIATSSADVDRFLGAIDDIANGPKRTVTYRQDPHTGDYWPDGTTPGWTAEDRTLGASCGRG